MYKYRIAGFYCKCLTIYLYLILLLVHLKYRKLIDSIFVLNVVIYYKLGRIIQQVILIVFFFVSDIIRGVYNLLRQQQ